MPLRGTALLHTPLVTSSKTSYHQVLLKKRKFNLPLRLLWRSQFQSVSILLERYGFIIGNSSGYIVNHLKEVKVGEPAQQVVKGLAKNKYVIVTTIGANILAVGSVDYYVFISNRYKKIVKQLIEKLLHFIQLAQKGEVCEEEVDNSLKFLQDNQKELLTLKLDSEIDEVFDLVYDYTIQFAKVNGFETVPISEVPEKNKVIKLMDYLNFQKTIYRSDAV